MGKVNRREFFEELIASQVESAVGDKTKDKVFEQYANKSMPKGLSKSTAGLNQYTGPWTQSEIIHLLRRTTFGVKYADVLAYQSMSMAQAVDDLLNVSTTPPAPPVNNYQGSYADPTGVTLGQTWVNAAYGDGTVDSYRTYSLKSWWTGLMINQDRSILEKMVLFWHNHFATEMLTTAYARTKYNYNAMLRANALGNFKTLVRKVTTEPHMLFYLNGYLNTKTAPDENYGRELQELFTVGKDYTFNYTEDDVKAAARVLTGWRVNTTTFSSYFDATKHDTSAKSFSSFYNNYVIGSNGANETDDLINMIFNKQETALYICKKLYRFFCYYDIDQATEINIIAPLAQTLVFNGFNIKPVLELLLKSEHFYDINSQGCHIRTPMDFLIGGFRSFATSIPTTISIDKQYALLNYIRSYGSLLNQELGDPPNVAGWPAYYQSPEYYEVWINSNTLPKRMQFMDMMLNSGFSAGTGTAVKFDVLNFAKLFYSPGDPNLLIDFCVDVLFGLDISATKKTDLKINTLLSGQTTDSYWIVAWSNYISNPNTINTNTVKTRLTSLLTELSHMAEYHLC